MDRNVSFYLFTQHHCTISFLGKKTTTELHFLLSLTLLSYEKKRCSDCGLLCSGQCVSVCALLSPVSPGNLRASLINPTASHRLSASLLAVLGTERGGSADSAHTDPPALATVHWSSVSPIAPPPTPPLPVPTMCLLPSPPGIPAHSTRERVLVWQHFSFFVCLFVYWRW